MEPLRGWWPLLLLLMGVAAIATASGTTGSDVSESVARKNLVRDLFVNYDTNSRPVPKGQAINVTMRLELKHLDFLDANGAMQIFGRLEVIWTDPKVRWEPRDYHNLTQLNVAPQTLWVPDMELYNNDPSKFFNMESRGIVLLLHTGVATWMDNVVISVFCESDFTRWPQEHHTCKLNLGSWTHDSLGVDILPPSGDSNLTYDNLRDENSKYEVVNYTATRVATTYPCCEYAYLTMNYELELRRRMSAFAVVFQMPALAVVLLTLAVFCLEPQRGEKLLLHAISLVIVVFNLLLFADSIGRHTRDQPLIVIFYSASFVLVTLGTLLSVFAISVSRAKVKSRLPPGLAKLLKSRLGRLLDAHAADDLKPDNADLHAQFEDVKLQESSNLILSDVSPDEWTRFAVVVERVAFIVFAIVFAILGICCFAL